MEAERLVRETRALNLRTVACVVVSGAVIAALAAFPVIASGYHLALGISLLYFTVIATARCIQTTAIKFLSSL